MKLNHLLSVSAVALAGLFASQASAVIAPGLELALLTDVSGSVDSTEYALQKTGYVNAFNSTAVKNAIVATPGGVRVTYIEWSGGSQQSTLVGWTLLQTAADSAAFATALNATSRAFSGSTAPGSAINFAVAQFAFYQGAKQVIDVSGDGAENDGANTLAARNAALTAGIDVINGLPILGEAGLLAFYQNNIQGGAGSFTHAAASFADFQAAIEQKLVREITGRAPDGGSTLILFSMILGAIGLIQRRKSLR